MNVVKIVQPNSVSLAAKYRTTHYDYGPRNVDTYLSKQPIQLQKGKYDYLNMAKIMWTPISKEVYQI